MVYQRYVAIGDSQTEGLNDGDDGAGYRGWADRLAALLAARDPQFRYANLAVRGHRAAQIRAGQLDAALALEPDLITVMAGMNDLVRPGFRADEVLAELEAMYAACAASGATVITFTYPDIGRIAPLVRRLRPRLLDFNERIRQAAERHGVVLVDTYHVEVTVDPRLWSADRIHATSLGHERIAGAVAHALGMGDGSWADPLPPLPAVPFVKRCWTEAAWAGTFLAPWVMRRIRGRSSGDGRAAKRPQLLPLT